MSLISEREQAYLSSWAKTAESRMAADMVHSASYFEERINEGTYLVEYVFDTISNMDKMIQKVLGNDWDEELRKVCEVAALKERSQQMDKREENKRLIIEKQGKEEDQIPEFIYNF